MSWFLKILGKDGVSQGVVKAASTAAVVTDEALVVAVSPNNAIAARVSGASGGVFDNPAGGGAPANALYVAGRAATANPVSEVNGDATPPMTDKAGRLVTTISHVRELVAIQTTNINASTAETTIITAGAAGVFNDLSCLIITSTDAAAAATITIKDATGGTTRMVFDYPDAALAPSAPLVIPFPIPVPQAVAANNWTATVSVNANSVKITAVFIKNL